jgi:hypothetical protein
MKSCWCDPVGENIGLDAYNEERWRHYKFVDAFTKGSFNILCLRCGGPLVAQDHIQGADYVEGIPKRQMVCGQCKWVGYKIL